jgi:hypothetical protein
MAKEIDTDDLDFIPVVEQVLDNGMAGIMLVCGAVAGAFAFWAFLEYQKAQKAKVIGVSAIPYPEIEYQDQLPEVRGDNRFNAFAQGEAGS